jgi:hypothetical protein
MAIYERSETYWQYEEIRDRDGALVDPSTVSLSIFDPCGVALVSDASMTKDDTGKYHYKYAISATAAYGFYRTLVTAEGSSGDITKFTREFFILPWNGLDNVRKLSGIKEEKTISDDDLGYIIWKAYEEAIDEIYKLHHNVTPKCDPSINVLFNGTNTTVKARHCYLADRNGDGSVTGFGEQSCGTDITGWWFDSSYARHLCEITVTDSVTGRLAVTQRNGIAIPSNNHGVYLTYWTQYESYSEHFLREAVEYLAANKVTLRFHELHRATLADLPSNQKRLELDLRRFEREYERLRDKIREPMIVGGR